MADTDILSANKPSNLVLEKQRRTYISSCETNIPVVCLMGPTAVGKTDLAMQLTQIFPFDIISVDSGMIYRGLDIGTAKPSREQLNSFPHQLVDICELWEIYSAGQFFKDAYLAIEKIIAKQRIPLLVGGTMMYFKVLQQGISNLPTADANVRRKIVTLALKFGWGAMHARLAKIDPKAAERIQLNDSQRIQRALEVYELTGKGISVLHELESPKPLPYKVINIIIYPESRDEQKLKIFQRLQSMLAQGFIAEVEQLRKHESLHIDLPAIRTVGYRQVWQYLENKITYAEMMAQVLVATNQLAKRQGTWLRSWDAIKFYREVGDTDKLLVKIIKAIKPKL
jgi:tRNA dimethylallyltransferase